MGLLSILRDATLRVAPQDEGSKLKQAFLHPEERAGRPASRRMGGKNSDPTRSPDALLTAAFYAPNTDTVFVLHMNRRDHAIFRAALGEILSIVIGEARE